MSTERKPKYHVRKRLFLNRDLDLPAYVIGVVEDTSAIPNDDEAWKWGEVELKLGDCFRRVTFDFHMDTRENRVASLYKINRVAEIVNAVRDAMEIEVNALNKRPPIKNKKSKK